MGVSAITTAAQRLSRLARLYEQGQASELMDRTLDKLFAYEIDLCRLQIGQLEEDLSELNGAMAFPQMSSFAAFKLGKQTTVSIMLNGPH